MPLLVAEPSTAACGHLWDAADDAVGTRLLHVEASFARWFGLRGYDAVHCAAAASLGDPDLVAASGDHALVTAWVALGMATLDADQGPSGTP